MDVYLGIAIKGTSYLSYWSLTTSKPCIKKKAAHHDYISSFIAWATIFPFLL